MTENKLKEYQEKRDFSRTKEPKGSVKKSSSPKDLKFSVQWHSARANHFDLRLEFDGVALSWAVPKGPSYNTKDKRLAMRVEDHPIDYMDFEGTIPKGEYGGGTVMLWDEGIWQPHIDPQKGLKSGSLKFRLDGERLKGDWALVRMKGDQEEKKEPWLLIKEHDSFAKKTSGITRFRRSVRSGRSMDEIADNARSNPFQKVDVMLAQLSKTLPKGKNWIYELKYDGHRTLAFAEKGTCRLYTRNGFSCDDRFPLIKNAIEQTLSNRAAVLDGETVVVNEKGVPDFGALQSFVKNGKGEGLHYVVFDLLALDGEDLRDLPLLERKEKLKNLIQNAPPILSYSNHTEKMTLKNLNAIKEKGMEGIVAKKADSRYCAGKNGDWQKVKFKGDREFVIGGYTRSEEGTFKSLLLGFFEEEELKFAGKVGTGFSESEKQELFKKFKRLEQKTSPFSSIPPKESCGAIFLKPALAAQIEYAEITASGLLRQASFKGLRTDKPIREITDEKPEKKPQKSSKKVKASFLTHPDKILFPKQKITKLALAKYYEAVAERMMPYLKDRFLSLVCCPSGIEEETFFRRHLDEGFQGVKNAPSGKDSDKEDYFYVSNPKGILSLVQYNAIEFHVRGSKKNAPEKPDIMVFDLDPDKNLPLEKLQEGALLLKEVLNGLKLRSFLKTSGGKGYHIVVPFSKGVDEKRFRDFAKNVAVLLEKSHPDLFVSSASKKVRKGKIYLDWQRNSPGSTSVAPYSVRARDGAPVSMPISWEELNEIAPNAVTIENALMRLRVDPWEDFFEVKKKQSLKL